jgi:hypothetical protein
MMNDSTFEYIDHKDIAAALQRAAVNAPKIAKQNGIPLVIWRDGKVALVDPDSIILPTPT